MILPVMQQKIRVEGHSPLREIINEAWHRFTIIGALVGDANARVISLLFYFTVLVPFGLISVLFTDPLRSKNNTPQWLDRAPVPTDLESAKEQG
jgi:hypothetical protein